MSAEHEVLNGILKIAKDDPKIRAVFQTGSRVNPMVERDRMQDFDFIYCVRNVDDFRKDKSFMEELGPQIFSIELEVDPYKNSYAVLLESGIKVDFLIYPVSDIVELINKETLLVLHMDKDNLIQQLSVSSDLVYRITRPTKNEFEDLIPNFFHKVIEALPELYRGNLLASHYLYREVFDIFNTMVGLYVADERDYKVSFGKDYRYMRKFMDPEFRQAYDGCLPIATFDGYWEALLKTMGVFRKCGLTLASRLSYSYPKETDVKLTAHIRQIYQIAQRDHSLRNI